MVEPVRVISHFTVEKLTSYYSQVFPEVKMGKSSNVRSNTLKFLNGPA